MITPELERKILCGEAVFKTYNVGFSSKTILDIPQGNIIVVTSVTYYDRVPSNHSLDTYEKNTAVTQLVIGTTRRNDVLVFRNAINAANATTVMSPAGSTTIDTFFVYDESVYFSFTDGQTVSTSAPIITPAVGTGQRFPLEYGKAGQPGTLAVSQSGSVPLPAPANSTRLIFGGIKTPNPTGMVIRYPGVRFPPINNAFSDNLASAPLATICYVVFTGSLPATYPGII